MTGDIFLISIHCSLPSLKLAWLLQPHCFGRSNPWLIVSGLGCMPSYSDSSGCEEVGRMLTHGVSSNCFVLAHTIYCKRSPHIAGRMLTHGMSSLCFYLVLGFSSAVQLNLNSRVSSFLSLMKIIQHGF